MSRTFTLSGIALAVTLALAVNAEAQQQKFLLIENPAPAIQPPPAPMFLPKFGFQSYNLSGIGERVTYVQCHGLASQLGLEAGDVILSLNGFPLNYHGAWNQALRNAMFQGGSVQIAVRDVRSGAVVYRSTFVGGTPGMGPITPKSYSVGTPGPIQNRSHHRMQPAVGAPSGPITQKSVSNNNNGRSTSHRLNVNSQSLQQLGRMLTIGE